MSKRGANLLDDLQIRRWIALGTPIAKSDGAGLTFTLSKAGTASWILRYMREGKPKELTIGNYPDISLAAARKTARARRVEIDEGLDPAATKKSARTQTKGAWTVSDLITDYKLKKLQPGNLAEGTIYYRDRDYTKVVKPAIGSLEVRNITPLHIIGMLEKSESPWTVQNRILISTTQLFKHAMGKHIIVSNPCVSINLIDLIGKRPPIKKRIMLSEEELRTLLQGIDSIGHENALALRIMLATCVRSVELVKARWEHIDFKRGTWLVPDESVKTRSGFLVPITPTVSDWFAQLLELSEGSEWVLPGRRTRTRDSHVGRTTLAAVISKAFLRGDIDTRRFTPHDTRSTAKGHMRNLGVSREISELALNHTLKGMEGIYDVREEIPERRAALEKWAAFIVACESGVPWNVTPINRVANAA